MNKQNLSTLIKTRSIASIVVISIIVAILAITGGVYYFVAKKFGSFLTEKNSAIFPARPASQETKMIVWQELDNDTLKYNLFLGDHEKHTKIKVNSQPIDPLSLFSFGLSKDKVIWVDEKVENGNASDKMHIYDIKTQREEKEFSLPFRVSPFNLLYPYENLIVIDKFIKGGTIGIGRTDQVILYNTSNEQIESLSEPITEPSLDSSFCLSGDGNKVVFEEKKEKQVEFFWPQKKKRFCHQALTLLLFVRKLIKIE